MWPPFYNENSPAQKFQKYLHSSILYFPLFCLDLIGKLTAQLAKKNLFSINSENDEHYEAFKNIWKHLKVFLQHFEAL